LTQPQLCPAGTRQAGQSQNERTVPANIALGLGDNIDYEIVWDFAGDRRAGRPIRESSQKSCCTRSRSAANENLLLSILQFLQSGTGGERFVDSSPLIEQFASRFTKKITLGGTSVPRSRSPCTSSDIPQPSTW
jgi:hypothetical protein